jgi:hypothetical protein
MSLGRRVLRWPNGAAAVAAVGVLAVVVFEWQVGRLVGPSPPADLGDQEGVAKGPAGRSRPADPVTPPTFAGDSTGLRDTVIVPTLDTPFPEGKSAVWCASFQLAWDRLKRDVAGEPVRVANAEQPCDRLNRAAFPEDGLPAGTYYAAAGRVDDGIRERIQAEMAKAFPDVPAPTLDAAPSEAIAYAFLKGGVKFRDPFFENDEPLTFTDSSGHATAVGSFGIRKKDDYAYKRLREQVQLLWFPRGALGREREVEEFVLDPCRSSEPNQIILARVGRKPTLAETLADVEGRIKDESPKPHAASLHPRDTLLVPAMHWQVTHHFRELEGEDKPLLNLSLRGGHIRMALLAMDFKLDHSGAELASEAKVFVKPTASYFHFNRPFLLIMKKRGGERPFFVVWVDNAELLMRR